MAQNSNFVPITTKITAQDAVGSNLNNLQYQISSSSTIPADNDANWKNFTSGANITENKSGGIWYLYTKVTDHAGNRATNVQKVGPFIVGGWQSINDYRHWYWHDPSTGERLKGWQYLPGNAAIVNDNQYWYYLDPKQDGRALMGWQLIDGYYYYFLEGIEEQCEGAMATGWVLLGNQWYYLKADNDGSSWTGPTGSMICGSGGGNITVWISNKNYTFNSSGHCLNP